MFNKVEVSILSCQLLPAATSCPRCSEDTWHSDCTWYMITIQQLRFGSKEYRKGEAILV